MARFPTVLYLKPLLGGNPLEFLDETFSAKTRGMGYRMVKVS